VRQSLAADIFFGITVSMCACLQSVEISSGCQTDVQNNVEIWYSAAGLRAREGIFGEIGRWILRFRLVGKKKPGDDVTDGLVTDFYWRGMNVNVDCGEVWRSVMSRKTRGNQKGWIDVVVDERLRQEQSAIGEIGAVKESQHRTP